jgi:hypothetical protein
MDVIMNSARLNGGRFQVFQNTDDVSVQFRQNRSGNHRFPVLRAEDQTDKDSGKGLWHRTDISADDHFVDSVKWLIYRRGFALSGLRNSVDAEHPGRCPGLAG